jgi:hypothetical protein
MLRLQALSLSQAVLVVHGILRLLFLSNSRIIMALSLLWSLLRLKEIG